MTQLERKLQQANSYDFQKSNKIKSAQIFKKVLCFRDESLGFWNETDSQDCCNLRCLALNTSGAGVVVFVHVVVLMVASFSVLQVTVLQVGIDVEVIVHAVWLLCVHLFWEIALQLLQLVLGEEVGLWKHDLMETTINNLVNSSAQWLVMCQNANFFLCVWGWCTLISLHRREGTCKVKIKLICKRIKEILGKKKKTYREVNNKASLLKRSAIHGHPFIQDTLCVSRLDQLSCN